jgi:hypothetical protein
VVGHSVHGRSCSFDDFQSPCGRRHDLEDDNWLDCQARFGIGECLIYVGEGISLDELIEREQALLVEVNEVGDECLRNGVSLNYCGNGG